MKTKRTVKVNRVPGDIATLELKLSWNTKTMPREQQNKLFEGIGRVLAEAMTDEEKSRFLEALRIAAAKPPAKKARKKADATS